MKRKEERDRSRWTVHATHSLRSVCTESHRLDICLFGLAILD